MTVSVKDCPLCSGDTVVVETRTRRDGTIRRRRTCLKCGVTFPTIEVLWDAFLAMEVGK